MIRAAEAALEREGFVSAVEVFLGIGWLAPSTLNEWKQGRHPSLEGALQPREASLSKALALLSDWAGERGLIPTEAAYVARTPSRAALQFSRSAEVERERRYRTHWLSAALSEKQRERLIEKARRPPELVVIRAHDEWKCHRCGGTGDLLIMEPPGPACLACAGLGTLEYLPSGDVGLTRRARASSAKFAVVVRFSRARKRYERQGLLVEPEALRSARRDP